MMWLEKFQYHWFTALQINTEEMMSLKKTKNHKTKQIYLT